MEAPPEAAVGLSRRDELPVLQFRSPVAWEVWLEKHHEASAGVWIKLAKKGSDEASVTHAEALETALCFGWIDGQRASLDGRFWLQRFTPRRPRSKWSKLNRAKIATLLAAGRLRPAGVRVVEAAKADGRWAAAYASQRTIEPPDDLRKALKAHPKAARRFEELDSKNRYAILYRIQDAKKPETRAARIQKYVDMLLAAKTIY